MFYIGIFITYFLSLFYLEGVFAVVHYGDIEPAFLYSALMMTFYAGVLTVLSGIGKKGVRKAVSFVLSSACVLFYIVNHIYLYVFKMYLSAFSVMTGTGGILTYYREIIVAVKANILYLLLYLVPVIFMVIFWVLFDRSGKCVPRLNVLNDWGAKVYVLVITFAVFFASVRCIGVMGHEMYSPYELYHYAEVPEMSVRNLGLMTTSRLDLKHLIFGNEEKTESADEAEPEYIIVTKAEAETPVASETGPHTSLSGSEKTEENVANEDENEAEGDETEPSEEEETPEPVVIDNSPNVLDIDFDSLIAEADNVDLKKMHEFFRDNHVTNKNKYTGMFKDYNFIMLTAEGFSQYAIDKDLTPTLYKLTHEGFVFDNFYTPLWGTSTTDGEYVACTGLIPKAGVWSFYRTAEKPNAMPFAFGNQFKALGYSTRAYHDHTYDYYRRDITHPNMGYDYKGVGNGLEMTPTWPESDLEMMEKTVPEYVIDEPFHTYYMTVSGHLYYTFEGNYMAYKNQDLVADLPYDTNSRAYIAANIELDRALESLIKQLSDAGVLDHTVIALSADHYPYGLDKTSIDNLAGHTVEENFELYREVFILWNSAMEEPVHVDKAACSMDIVPTINNLFGLPYDSRLFMGQDLLSDEQTGFVVFANRSFITDKVRYNSITKKAELLTDEPLPDDYIKNTCKKVSDMFAYSAKIIEKDYYKFFK